MRTEPRDNSALLARDPGDAGSHPHVSIEGLRIDNFTMDEAQTWIRAALVGPEPRQVSFLNADCVNLARHDPEYRHVLLASCLVLADGIGLQLAGRMLRRPIRDNVNGTDLFPRLCRDLEASGQSLFLLGGQPGVADGVAEWLRKQYPQLRVAGTRDGYFTAAEEPDVVRQIAAARADVLLVAFGAPRQEKWIRRHLPDTGAKLAFGVGGLFDFYSGRIPRAPLWMRRIGLEWFFRLGQEPRRLWKRYLVGNFIFMAHISREKLRGR